jgi:hypothetical protein
MMLARGGSSGSSGPSGGGGGGGGGSSSSGVRDSGSGSSLDGGGSSKGGGGGSSKGGLGDTGSQVLELSSRSGVHSLRPFHAPGTSAKAARGKAPAADWATTGWAVLASVCALAIEIATWCCCVWNFWAYWRDYRNSSELLQAGRVSDSLIRQAVSGQVHLSLVLTLLNALKTALSCGMEGCVKPQELEEMRQLLRLRGRAVQCPYDPEFHRAGADKVIRKLRGLADERRAVKAKQRVRKSTVCIVLLALSGSVLPLLIVVWGTYASSAAEAGGAGAASVTSGGGNYSSSSAGGGHGSGNQTQTASASASNDLEWLATLVTDEELQLLATGAVSCGWQMLTLLFDMLAAVRAMREVEQTAVDFCSLLCIDKSVERGCPYLIVSNDMDTLQAWYLGRLVVKDHMHAAARQTAQIEGLYSGTVLSVLSVLLVMHYFFPDVAVADYYGTGAAAFAPGAEPGEGGGGGTVYAAVLVFMAVLYYAFLLQIISTGMAANEQYQQHLADLVRILHEKATTIRQLHAREVAAAEARAALEVEKLRRLVELTQRQLQEIQALVRHPLAAEWLLAAAWCRHHDSATAACCLPPCMLHSILVLARFVCALAAAPSGPDSCSNPGPHPCPALAGAAHAAERRAYRPGRVRAHGGAVREVSGLRHHGHQHRAVQGAGPGRPLHRVWRQLLACRSLHGGGGFRILNPKQTRDRACLCPVHK